jgi:hypothetical protein
MAKRKTAAVDPQEALDRDDAAHFRKLIRGLAQGVRACQEAEVIRKGNWREKRRERADADGELARMIEDDGEGSDGAFLANLDLTCRQAEEAKQREHEAHDAWVLAVTARRQAQDELRVTVRRRFAPAPLFDAPAGSTNGTTKKE